MNTKQMGAGATVRRTWIASFIYVDTVYRNIMISGTNGEEATQYALLRLLPLYRDCLQKFMNT
jgi:hypothetical protein